MKTNLSLFYQFFLSTGTRSPYKYTILVSIFFIFIHLVLIQDILRIGFNAKNFLLPNFILAASISVVVIIVVFYRKNTLLNIRFSQEELRSKIILRSAYLLTIILLSLILEKF